MNLNPPAYLLDSIAGISVWSNRDGSISYLSAAAIDGDGSGPSHGDPDYQNSTSLLYQGKPLDADQDRYIVLPLRIIRAVAPVVLGCKALLMNIRTGRQVLAVAGDEGPDDKLGEFSIACASPLGIPDSPTSGGTDDHVIAVILWPGVAAEVGGRLYELQPHAG